MDRGARVHGVAKSRSLSNYSPWVAELDTERLLFFFFEQLLFKDWINNCPKDWINNCPSRKACLIFLFFLFPPSPSPPLGHAENSA